VPGPVPAIHVFLLQSHRCKTWMTGGSPVKGLWNMIEFLMVAGAPTPVAPFSHATACEGWLFVTGQMPTDAADDNVPLPEGIEAQTRRVLDNLKLVLAGAGGSVEQILFARVYLTQFERDYAAMNWVYQSYFAPGRLPARTCIGVTGLARGALVEIDLLARRAQD
jgi:2-iminobutanoate/2-iminopropanoate deaminase